MKRCPTCTSEKPLDYFYSDKRARDGHKSQCKACHTAGSIRTRDEDRKRAANAIHMANARAADPAKFRARERAASEKKRTQHPERVAARQTLNNALKRGDIVKPVACEQCGNSRKLTGHHDDYSKPLAVQWLCYTCHGLEHRNNNSKRL